jgi:hypothetical protein
MEVSGQLHAPAALPPGKEPWYPLYRRLGGPQSRYGHGGEEKNYQTQPGFDSRRELGIFLFTTASRTALGPIQPPSFNIILSYTQTNL